MKRSSIVVFLCIAVFLAIAFFYWFKNFKTISLDDISISTLSVNGKTYSFQYGKILPKDENYDRVLHLAYFYQWVKEDPLFVPPGLDSNKLASSLNLLEETEQLVLRANGNTNPLLPMNFLKTIPLLADKTNQFLESPSDEKGLDLIESYKKSANLYSQAADDFGNTIKKEMEVNENHRQDLIYVFIGIAITKSTIQNDISLLEKNSLALHKEINTREDCLLRKGRCIRPAENFKALEQSAREETAQNILPLKVLFDEAVDADNLKGPYGARSVCLGWSEDFTQPFYFFYLLNSSGRFPKEQNLQVQYTKIVSERIFRKMSSRNPDDQILIEKGLVWDPQNETNTYICPNMEYLTALSTIDSVFSRNLRLFDSADLTEIPSKLKSVFNKGLEVEKTFFEYPNEDNLNILASYYAFAYKIIGETIKDTAQKDADWVKKITTRREQILNTYLAIIGRLENFDLLLNRANEDLFSLALKAEVKDIKYNSYYLYAYRSIYGLMYLPFSPLTWKEENKLSYVDRKKVRNAVGVDQTYMTYKQALELYTMEEIEKWYVDKAEIIQSLYDESKNRL